MSLKWRTECGNRWWETEWHEMVVIDGQGGKERCSRRRKKTGESWSVLHWILRSCCPSYTGHWGSWSVPHWVQGVLVRPALGPGGLKSILHWVLGDHGPSYTGSGGVVVQPTLAPRGSWSWSSSHWSWIVVAHSSLSVTNVLTACLGSDHRPHLWTWDWCSSTHYSVLELWCYSGMRFWFCTV